MTDVELTLAALGRMAHVAEGQHGQVTQVQAAAAGLDAAALHQLFRCGVIEGVTAEVVRIRGGARAEFPELYAEWLCLDPATPAWERVEPACAVVSHGSALRVYRIGGPSRPGVEFTAPPTVAAHRRTTATIYPASLPADQVRRVGGLPVTTPARTLGDVATRLDLEELLRVADAFAAQGWATREQLRTELTARPPVGLNPDLTAGLLSALTR